jgi:DNA-directed RNA polymerase subunit RPC12/RpoP
MTFMRKDLTLDIGDIRNLDIQCSECGVHITMDILDERTKIPKLCPSCHHEFELVGVQQAIAAYMDGCRTLVKVRHKITVHVPVE